MPKVNTQKATAAKLVDDRSCNQCLIRTADHTSKMKKTVTKASYIRAKAKDVVLIRAGQFHGLIKLLASVPVKAVIIVLIFLVISSQNSGPVSTTYSLQTMSFNDSPSLIKSNSNNQSEILSLTTTTALPKESTTAVTDSLPSSSQNEPTTATTVEPTMLLSNNEFVDFTEAPTLLFDGTSLADEDHENKKTNETITGLSPSNHTETTSQPEIKLTSMTDEKQPETSSKLSDARLAIETIAHPSLTTAINMTSDVSENSEDNDRDSSTMNSGDDSAGKSSNTESSEQDHDTNSDVFQAPQNISQYMDYIEKLFRDLRHQITDLFEPHIPQLIRTSQSVDLSSSCSFDMLRLAFALRQFEPWALKMIDSSGKVPEGIFEGSFTALGSYDECLNVVFRSAASQNSETSDDSDTKNTATNEPQQTRPTQGKYCLVTVSPFLPPKPPVDKVDLLFQEEANKRNYTKDDQFSRLSPMFYYMKFRIGVCIPSTCEQGDMDSISSALSSSLRLNITIPDCRVKQAQSHSSRHQFYAGLIIFLILMLVVGATLFDCLEKKFKRLRKRELQILSRVETRSFSCSDVPSLSASNPNGVVKVSMNDGNISDHNDSATTCDNQTSFLNKLSKHWCWMSFSVVTNFNIYFKSKITKQQSDQKLLICCRSNSESGPTNNQHLIKCLDGIRVLSLCWVVVANSYLTLDPRATKRLTKTREAPRDFLFQLVVQASLAIETFFFLSGLLMSLSFIRKFRNSESDVATTKSLKSTSSSAKNEAKSRNSWLHWVHFYVHRYVRMTPATMLVIALSMYAYQFGDGPIWHEATRKAHDSCTQNWWRHLLHVANYIDTRQMCFIHYWYISADMQLFLFTPILLFLIIKYKYIGYTLMGLIGSGSIFSVFYATYVRNLPPTLLFYSSDPESRREFGNTIMTKPSTHVLPYFVGMLVGHWLASRNTNRFNDDISSTFIQSVNKRKYSNGETILQQQQRSMSSSVRPGKLCIWLVVAIALIEIFLPYRWNNSHLPTRLMASIYASLFRLGWSLVLAYVVISCGHKPSARCSSRVHKMEKSSCKQCNCSTDKIIIDATAKAINKMSERNHEQVTNIDGGTTATRYCFCGSGGSLVNRLLGLSIFTHLSKLSFVAYLIHLPLMSLFVQQTRGLFAFSHILVIHLAISYLVLTFSLSFVFVHIIEFPFITFERILFDRLFYFSRRGRYRRRCGSFETDNQRISKNDKIWSENHQINSTTSHKNIVSGYYQSNQSNNHRQPKLSSFAACGIRTQASSKCYNVSCVSEEQLKQQQQQMQTTAANLEAKHLPSSSSSSSDKTLEINSTQI